MNTNTNQILDLIKSILYLELKNILNQYSKETNVNLNKELDTINIKYLENKLDKLHINCTCPKCGFSLKVKNCKKLNDIQEYKCKECNHLLI